ncbi:MAG: hypothetical protein H0X02_09905 [Nitrosomonas sp.]|nr:hypothetical protein [Nitrosomonas sp.]
MSKLPTDREVLKCIFEMYEAAYPGETNGEKGINDPYVPVDLWVIAAKLNTKPELLFGRLYYHLDAKHRYKQGSGAWVSLFLLNIENKGHSVHFPYLSAILAGHDQEYRKQFWTMAFSILALVLSVMSLITNLLTKI